MLVIKLILNLKISGLERKAIEGNLALKGLSPFFPKTVTNVVRASVTHSAAPRVPLFCSYHILTSSVIYY